MTDNVKHHLYKIMNAFIKQTEINQFNMYFDLRGKLRYRIYVKREELDVEQAMKIFMRVFKERFAHYVSSNGYYKHNLGLWVYKKKEV